MKNLLLLLAFAYLLVVPAAAQKKSKYLTPADFPKKIAEVEPEPLPQTPKIKRVSSDANDEALKGKVKSVIEWSYEGRRKDISKEEYFDDEGYLTRSIDYLDGYPDSVTVWGFLDGMRVLRSGDIKYADGEKPPPPGMILSVRAEDNSIDPRRPRDRRYSMRHEYIYDNQNRLIEDRNIQNSGELWSRTTYTWEGSVRTERNFGNTGDEHSKTAETLDGSGNVVRREMFGSDEDTDVTTSTYDLDRIGNWIKKNTYEERSVGKRKVKKLLWTTYRTITYYP